VRGVLRSGPADGDNLPRMSPARVGLDLGWRAAGWNATLGVLHVQRQDRVAVFDLRDGEPESPTDGYTRVDASLAWRPDIDLPLTVYVQGRNLGNADMRIHTSYLKDLAPPPGRSLLLGLRMRL
jgi:iron complex outermembrane receptor protein